MMSLSVTESDDIRTASGSNEDHNLLGRFDMNSDAGWAIHPNIVDNPK